MSNTTHTFITEPTKDIIVTLLQEILELYKKGCDHWEPDRKILNRVREHYRSYQGQINEQSIYNSLSQIVAEDNTPAHINLQAFLTRWGFGTIPDIKKAFQLFHHSAVLGDPVAQSELGYFYNNELGITRNREMAHKWYSQSAKQGYPLGQSNLAYWYLCGGNKVAAGEKSNGKKAVYWYLKAADAGLASAEARLGLLFQKGIGTMKDKHEALRYYRKAVVQKNENARIGLEWMMMH
ncbi:10732_t:CDS:1 [Ambispora gerdemannii]|uniref:10732_t:CDS:1 n=1 Tax=Ambispora gerdemannii TaxID=144530 RepID=A0A9N9FC48_9GLOM|nr:10732_t:CDS:1 [Ambispora gerdemannii]